MFDLDAILFEIAILLMGLVFGGAVYSLFYRFLDIKPKRNWLYLILFAICFAGIVSFISLFDLPVILVLALASILFAVVMSAVSKVEIIKAIITVIISLLIPLSVMYFSLAITMFAINPTSPTVLIIGVFMSIPVQVVANWGIYHFPAIKRSAEVFTKDAKLAISVLVLVLTFGAFTFLTYTFDFAEDQVGFYFVIAGMALMALVGFLLLLAWIMAPSKKKPLREVFNRFGFFGYEGGKFLYSLIIGAIEDKFTSDNLNDIFPVLAEEYNKTLASEEKPKTAKNVEANMRDSIKAVWTTVSKEILDELYKGPISEGKDWPTITQFYMHYVETYRDEKK